MRFFFYPIASLLFAIAPAAALHAATINQTFIFADMSNYGFETGSEIAQFNSALGTLNSVSYSFTVTSTVNPPLSNSQALGYYSFELGPINELQNISEQPLEFSGTRTSAFSLFYAYIGNGFLVPYFGVQPYPGENGNGYSSVFSLGTVTYNYTPSTTSSVPETSSFSLLGAGLVVVGFLGRRSRSRRSIR